MISIKNLKNIENGMEKENEIEKNQLLVYIHVMGIMNFTHGKLQSKLNENRRIAT